MRPADLLLVPGDPGKAPESYPPLRSHRALLLQVDAPLPKKGEYQPTLTYAEHNDATDQRRVMSVAAPRLALSLPDVGPKP